MTPPALPTPNVVPSVVCECCATGYVPTSKQTGELVGVADRDERTSTATEYAIDAGWFQRADGSLLCASHAEIGDQPLPKRMGWRELCRRYPSRRDDRPPQ